MLHKNLTFLIGPEVSNEFFNLPDDAMSQKEVYEFMTPVFGKGVVYDAEPKKRLQQTTHMSKALLRRDAMEKYVEQIERETYTFLRAWKQEGEVDLLDALSKLTILTSSRCLHGDDVREGLFEEVSNLYHDLDKGVTPLSFFFPYAPTEAHRLRDKARAEMVKIFSKIIQARKDKPDYEETKKTSTDILQVFIDLKYTEAVGGGSLSNDEVVGLLIALLFAGQHTSSITSTWTSMFLIHHPECMEKFLSEQSSLLADGAEKRADEELNAEAVSKSLNDAAVTEMKYLEQCIMEALRMHPPLIMLMRMAKKDIPVKSNGKEYVIPKGDICVTSPAVASRMPEVFENPNKFDPDRFGPERQEDKKQKNAFLGFGAGHHQCLGQRFGVLQVKTIVSILLRNFKFTPVDKEFPEPDYTAMVVGPKNNCRVRYTKLASSSI